MPELYLPPPDRRFIDERTGLVDRQWYRFLSDLKTALGSLTFADIAGVASVAQIPAHGTTHHQGGSDAVKLDDLATPDDTTDLDVTNAYHGLVPKLTGNALQSLRGDGSWA